LIITSENACRALPEFLEELVGVGRREVLELGPADLRIDPVLGLAGDGGHRVRVSLDRVEPVPNAQFDGVRGRRADAGLDLVAELVEVVFDFGLGLAADAGAVARLAVAVVAERELADVALVGLVPSYGSVAAVAAATLRPGWWGFVGHRTSLLSGVDVLLPSTVPQGVPRRPLSFARSI
jgi:hypothetical protein